MNIFKRLKAKLRYRAAKQMADKEHLLTGNRYYILPMQGKGKKLLVVNRYNFRKLKLKHYLPEGLFIRDLEAACYYCTPYADGSKSLNETEIAAKYRRYLNWFAD
ncbi:MAG: hypothetical protein HDT08_04330 [Bacteroidales bacterium]|nr:hypothetical protein [Bacteroidales bacterium]